MAEIRTGELMNMKHGRPPVLMPGFSFGSVTDKIANIVIAERTPLAWWLTFLPCAMLVGVLGTAVTYLFYRGVGI